MIGPFPWEPIAIALGGFQSTGKALLVARSKVVRLEPENRTGVEQQSAGFRMKGEDDSGLGPGQAAALETAWYAREPGPMPWMISA